MKRTDMGFTPKKRLEPLSIISVMFFILAFSSCISVKPYQKMYLNDEDMKLSPRQLESFETGIESYREGSSGANGGKTGGGCGCN